MTVKTCILMIRKEKCSITVISVSNGRLHFQHNVFFPELLCFFKHSTLKKAYSPMTKGKISEGQGTCFSSICYHKAKVTIIADYQYLKTRMQRQKKPFCSEDYTAICVIRRKCEYKAEYTGALGLQDSIRTTVLEWYVTECAHTFFCHEGFKRKKKR